MATKAQGIKALWRLQRMRPQQHSHWNSALEDLPNKNPMSHYCLYSSVYVIHLNGANPTVVLVVFCNPLAANGAKTMS